LTGQLAINVGAATSINAGGGIQAASFVNTGASAFLGPASAGTVLLRPNGVGSTSGQFAVGLSGNAQVAGTLDLGNATDATLARVSAGVVSVEGQNILTAATGAPIGAEFITSTSDATLTAERVLTDTATVTWDRTTAGQIKANATGGGGGAVTVNVQTFTASGTYTPSAGMRYCTIECVGGGGGGGGVGDSTGSSYSQSGGGSGGYSRKTVAAASVGASQTVTIGTAGTAGSAGTGGNGGNGGNTSVGTLCVANGGGGGKGSSANPWPGGVGGTITGAVGDVVAAGNPGVPGYTGGAVQGLIGGGNGGASYFGGGGSGASAANGGSVVGGAATNYGSGGGGAAGSNVATGRTGGAGAAGFVIITEYL
jgi:hypothetical protein